MYKSRIITIIIVILIISNCYTGFGYIKRGLIIDKFFQGDISLYKNHIAEAYNNMQLSLKYNSPNYKIKYLTKVQKELESAMESARLFSNYYNYNRSDNRYYIGNVIAKDFYGSYIIVLDSWISAYENNDISKIPTSKELNDLYEDMRSLTDIFQVYLNVDYSDSVPLEELGMEGLKQVFIRQVKDTKSKDVYNELSKKSIFKEYIECEQL